HGMGYLGLGSSMAMLGMAYGDEKSVEFTAEVTKEMAMVGWAEGLELAKEKGPAPVMNELFEITEKHLRQNPYLVTRGYKAGDTEFGAVLFTLSPYMQRIADVDPELVKELAKHGSRFSHHTSIAPTGTISLSLGNNASNGIEPSFAHSYMRNVIVKGKDTKEQVEVTSFELLAYRHFIKSDATPADLPASCVDASTIDPKAHVDVQAAAQYWVDSSISKTINVPTDYPYEQFKDLYLYAYQKGLKGCTTFRFNPEAFQGVLVKQEDLDNTVYVFELKNGEKIEARGSDVIVYEGQEHKAANLFDALKEGYYGKF